MYPLGKSPLAPSECTHWVSDPSPPVRGSKDVPQALAERQIGRAPLIDLTAEEEPVVGNEENVVPIPVPASFVLPMIAPEHVLVPVDELVDSDEETVVEGALDSV